MKRNGQRWSWAGAHNLLSLCVAWLKGAREHRRTRHHPAAAAQPLPTILTSTLDATRVAAFLTVTPQSGYFCRIRRVAAM